MEGLMTCTIVPQRISITLSSHFGTTRNCYSVCVDRVSQNRTRLANVSISAMLKDVLRAHGLLMKYDWQLTKATKFQKFKKYTNTKSHNIIPTLARGGLFVEYINTILKLKQEASGYPDWVRSADDEDLYIRQFYQSEGIRLDKDSIRYNAAKRGLAKLSQLHVGKTDREKQPLTDKINFRTS